MRIVVASIAGMALVCGMVGAAYAQPPGAVAPKPAGQPEAAKVAATWIRLDGLDTTGVASAMVAAMNSAKEREGGAVVIEIGSAPLWRADVLRDVLLAMKEAKGPVHVHVTDTGSGGKKGVSRAVLLMGLAATSWSCVPAVLGEGDPVRLDDEGRNREYVVEKTDWSLVEGDVRDVAAWVWGKAGGTAERADLLAFAKEKWWGVEPKKLKEAWTLSSGEKPKSDEGRVHALDAADAFVPMAALVPEGSLPSKAATVAAAAKARGLRVSKEADARGPANLNAQYAQVGSRLESAKASLEAAERRLKSAEDLERKAAKPEAERVRKDLTAVEKTIGEIEDRLAATPELTRMVPPGKADVASKPSSQPARWRSAVQSLKDRASKAGVKVSDLLNR